MRWILPSAVILSLGPAVAPAQSLRPASGWVPTLAVRPVPSHPEGARVSELTGYLWLAKGEPASGTIWWGRSLCSFVYVSGDASPQDIPASFGVGTAANVWKITGNYLGEQNGRYQVRVTSGFTRLEGSASTSSITQTLSLRDGDTVVLDALKESPEAACPVRIVTFEARLALQPTDPALARARYTADMWLVHTDPDGKEQREHLVMNVDGSLVVPFMFNRLAFPIPQVDARQGNAEAVIQLTGALRARPRADGLVDLDIETNRFLFGLENPDGPIRSVPTTVRKTLTMKENETTAVDFPPPSSGFASILLDRNDQKAFRLAARPGKFATFELANGTVVAKEGRLVLNTASFFRGHKTQMLITLKPLR
jgi:hypothetical protein